MYGVARMVSCCSCSCSCGDGDGDESQTCERNWELSISSSSALSLPRLLARALLPFCARASTLNRPTRFCRPKEKNRIRAVGRALSVFSTRQETQFKAQTDRQERRTLISLALLPSHRPLFSARFLLNFLCGNGQPRRRCPCRCCRWWNRRQPQPARRQHFHRRLLPLHAQAILHPAPLPLL